MGKIKRVAAAGFYIPLAPPVGTENLFAQLQDILRQLHPNSRILLMANSLSFVTYSPQNPPVLLPLKTVCLAWDTPPFPASAVAKGITHYTLQAKSCAKWNSVPFGYPCQGQRCFPLDTLCQQGCCSPLLETQSQRGFAPLDAPPVQQRLGKGERKALLSDKFELDIFVLRCENLLF